MDTWNGAPRADILVLRKGGVVWSTSDQSGILACFWYSDSLLSAQAHRALIVPKRQRHTKNSSARTAASLRPTPEWPALIKLPWLSFPRKESDGWLKVSVPGLNYGRNTSKLELGYWKAIYASRTKQLEETLETAGPFKIQSLTIYEARIADQVASHSATPTAGALEVPRKRGGEDSSVGILEFSFPRNESPSTAETERWNRLVEERIRKFAGKPESGTEIDVSFGITYAAQDVISLEIGMMYFEQGTAHPNFAGAGYIVLLRSGRELQASDLFTPTKSWKTFLNGIVFRKLKAQAAKEDWPLEPRSAAELHADDLKRWTISKQGLKISFVQYEVSGYASGPHEVVVSWDELKPYLNAALPFVLPQP
jgi:hypothetical protein